MQEPKVAKALETQNYLSTDEIETHLEGVEYIIMAAPAPDQFKETPIHFTIFLNTRKRLPPGVKEAVLDKFCEENKITVTAEVLSQFQAVGFAATGQETPQPMLLIKPEDIQAIPHTALHVMDFLGDSTEFPEAKIDSLTGWSYSYDTSR